MKVTRGILAAIVFSSATAHASIITLESQWCCSGMPGTMTFSYDDAIIDGVNDDYLDGPLQQNQVQLGYYSNAIVDARYVVNSGVDSGKIYSFVQGSSNQIGINRKFNANGTSVSIFFNLFDGIEESLWNIGIEGYPPLTDSLQELPTIAVADMATMFSSGPLTGHAFSILRYDNNLAFKQVASVPEPATLSLFVAGVIGLFAANRRHRVVR